MMITGLGRMYLRPGNLWKSFRVLRKTTGIDQNGYPKETFKETGMILYGVLAEAQDSANDRMKLMWDQEQHSLTHTMVARGKPDLKRGDFLTCDERAWLVLYNDDVGALGLAGLVYLEERNDVK